MHRAAWSIGAVFAALAMTVATSPSAARAQASAAAPAPSPALSRSADILVPFDPDRGTITLYHEQASALNLSPAGRVPFEVRVFQSQEADSALSLEILWLEGERLVRERRPLTRDELTAMRARVAAAAAATAALNASQTAPPPEASPAPRPPSVPEPPYPHGPTPTPAPAPTSTTAWAPPPAPRLNAGRASLLTGSAIVSLGFYSWAVPVALDLHERDAVGVGMLSAASGFFVPLLLTPRANVTTGMSNLSFYGSTRGIVHGLALHDWIAGEPSVTYGGDYVSIEDDDNERLAATVAGSVCEGVAGYFWARQAGLDAGRAQTIAVAGDFGILWGLGIAELLDDDDNEGSRDERRLRGASITLASAASLAGGALAAGHRSYNWGDAEIVRTTGLVVAGLAAATIDVGHDIGADDPDRDDGLSDPNDDPKPYIAAAMAASLAGIVLGDRLVAGADFSPGQALLADLGTLAGGALGLAAAYLLTHDPDESGPFTIGAALGGAGGFALTYRLTRPDAVRRAASAAR